LPKALSRSTNCQDSHPLGEDLKPVPPIYEAGVPPTQLKCLVSKL